MTDHVPQEVVGVSLATHDPYVPPEPGKRGGDPVPVDRVRQDHDVLETSVEVLEPRQQVLVAVDQVPAAPDQQDVAPARPVRP
jgi:hypothetical protein